MLGDPTSHGQLATGRTSTFARKVPTLVAECTLAWAHQLYFAASSPLLQSTAFSVSIDTEDRA